jgi:hypothetical protein
VVVETKSRRRDANARPSILYSALIVFGMVLTLLGAVGALLGFGGLGQNALSGLGFSINSAGPGLVVATLGVIVIYLATRKTRGEVKVFGVVSHAALDRAAAIAPLLLLTVLLIDVGALLWALLG